MSSEERSEEARAAAKARAMVKGEIKKLRAATAEMKTKANRHK
jgi:hypothetical protein